MLKDPESLELRVLLRKAGWHSTDGLWQRDGRLYAVSSLAFSQSWERHAPALLSQAILLSRALARRRGPDVIPVAALQVPRATARLDSRLARFVSDDLGLTSLAWLLFDAAGAAFPHVPSDPGFADRIAQEPRLYVSIDAPRPHPFNLFSDLNQWLLKVLLAPKVPKELLSAPRGPSIHNPTALAHLAGVSVPTASRFLVGLEALGLLHRGVDGLQIAEPLALLQRWRDQMAHPGTVDVGARFVRGPLDTAGLREVIAQALRRGQGSFPIQGLFGACELLGFGHVFGAPPLLYLEDLTPAHLEPLGLAVASAAGTVEVVLRVPRHPRSVLKGAVSVAGLKVTDLIQCWLDTSHYRIRGQEQADFLWRRALAPLWS